MRETRIGLLLVGALALTACGGEPAATSSTPAVSGAASTSPSPLPSYATARDELMAGLARTVATTSAYAVEYVEEGTNVVSSTTTGVSDPVHRAVSGKTESKHPATTTLEIMIIGDDLYNRGGLAPLGAQHWTHMKLSRAPLAAGLGLPAVVSSVTSTGGAIVEVDKTGPGAFKGTLDPAKADKVSLLYSAKKKSLPFEATLDAHGYATTLVLHLPPVIDGIEPIKLTVHIADIGKPVTIVAPPAAEVKEVPEDAYRLYGGS